MDDSLYDKMWEYVKKYDDVFEEATFPTIPLCSKWPPEEVIANINKCLETGKTIEEMGMYKTPPLDVDI
ncbi:MAG: hypothetical protein K6C05_08415 [Anaerovibrio sp.]|uniref:hypothetical protein n=1 Tax=Anaerovibrio sp. TaxID=1872532 RepID=UPI0025EE139B|nr:hypothetical protein [Anaerovibrio sp.]MCR5176860.1 hypothetical protein [Anaerovibrio sp.]